MSDKMTAPEGPMAFPCCVPFNGGTFTAPGMTLRDYFAGQALAGCIAKMGPHAMSQEQYALDAYYKADAMLTARQEPSA